jgi:hypothetical protein
MLAPPRQRPSSAAYASVFIESQDQFLKSNARQAEISLMQIKSKLARNLTQPYAIFRRQVMRSISIYAKN